MELTNRGDFSVERALRRRNPVLVDHLIGIFEQPSVVMALVAVAAARRHPRVAACIIAAPLLALGGAAIGIAAAELVGRAGGCPRSD